MTADGVINVQALVEAVLELNDGDEIMVSTACFMMFKAGLPREIELVRRYGAAVTAYMIGRGWLEIGEVVIGEGGEHGADWVVVDGPDEWISTTVNGWLDLAEIPSLGGPFVAHMTAVGVAESIRRGHRPGQRGEWRAGQQPEPESSTDSKD